MNLPRIFERAYLRPLAVSTESFTSFHAFMWPRITGASRSEFQALGNPKPQAAAANYRAIWGRRPKACAPTMDPATGTVDGDLYYLAAPGIACVPIYGALTKNLQQLDMCEYTTDLGPISQALSQAAAAPAIHTILLDVSSPGGEVTGIAELGAKIRAIAGTKRVITFCDEDMCSAAYWLGSQASEIVATPSACVGSIGVYCAWLDPSKKLEADGYVLQFFGAGKYKGEGLLGKPLSADFKAMLQARVLKIYDQFTTAVRTGRGTVGPRMSAGVADDTMQGQTFDAEQAQSLGLVDHLVSDWDELIPLLSR